MRLKIQGFLIAIVVATLLPATAQAQYNEGVIYSLMPVRVGAQTQYALVPLPVQQLRPDLPVASSVPAAMGLLRYASPDRYGSTSAEVVNDTTVRVTVDPIVASQFEVIAAESVYTLTQLGIDTVEFPGLSDTPLTRADIPYATYRQQIPLWQALVGGRLYEADILLPGGERVDADAFYDGFEAGESALHEATLQVLREGQVVEQYGILTVVAGLEIPGYEAAVAPLLTHEDSTLRASALSALQTSRDEAAWDAVVAMMNDDADPAMRDAAAAALGASPLEAFHLYTVVHRANGGLAASADPVAVLEGRVAAVGEAPSYNDPRMVDALVRLLGDEEVRVRDAVIASLTEMSAFGAMRAVMDDAAFGAEVRMSAALALADAASGEERRAGLEFRGMNTEGDLAKAAVTRLHTDATDVDVRPTIEGFLRHPDVNVAVHAAALLGERAELASLDALSEVGTDSASADEVVLATEAAAFDIMSALPLADVEPYTWRGTRFQKRAAYRALGALAQSGGANARVFGVLTEGLASSDDAVVGAACQGVGIYANSDAMSAIEGALASASPAVEADCAFALANFAGDEALVDRAAPFVSGFVDSGSSEVVVGGLYAAGELGLMGLQGAVLALISYEGDHLVRRYAMEAARKLADPAETRPAINGISAGLTDDVVDNRIAACEQLGYFEVPLAVLTLSQVVNDLEPTVRYAAIAATAATGHADAIAVLTGLLEDPERDVRLAAVQGLRDLGMASAIPQIESNISRDPDPVTQQAQQELIEYLRAYGQ